MYLISVKRLQRGYVVWLGSGIVESWVPVLHKHEANRWPSFAARMVPLRKLKPWLAYLARSGPAAHIRCRRACG